MDIKIPGINADSGLELCDGSEKIYIHSLRLFVSNIPASLEKLKNVSKDTLASYAIAVHGVKGVSQYVGADEAVDTAKQLEAMAKEGNLDGVMAANNGFIQHMEKLLNNVKTWLERNTNEK